MLETPTSNASRRFNEWPRKEKLGVACHFQQP